MDDVQPAPYRLERITKMANLVDYVKTVWENGKTALNAARMNNMEQGISNCATQINKLGDSVSRKSNIGKALSKAEISSRLEIEHPQLITITVTSTDSREYTLCVLEDSISLWDQVNKKTLWTIGANLG